MRRVAALTAVLLALTAASGEAFLHPVERVPSGEILDHSATQFLVAEGQTLRIVDRATGAEEQIPLPSGFGASTAFLSPHGAIFVAGGVHEWRDGALIPRSGSSGTFSLAKQGSYAEWNVNSTLFREDLTTGVVTQLSTTAGNNSNDVGPNGDVVWWHGSDYDVFRSDGSSPVQLTNDNNAVHWNTYPLTDGINVVYRKHSPCCFNDSGSVAVYTPGGEVVLDSFRNSWPNRYTDYDLAGGWVAYTHVGPGGERQTWRRSPAGDVSQVSPDGLETRIAEINASGDVLFTAGGTLFVAKVGSPPVDVGNGTIGIERGQGSYYFSEGGRWFLAHGTTLYELAAGYPRPKGATPSRFSLAQAYEPCDAPNRIHGPPLGSDSCHPPQRASDYLTVGTADANARPVKSEGYVLLTAVSGAPATPADEADVEIDVHISDVRRADDLEDYTGELVLDGTMRITDRDTGGLAGGTTHGTVRNLHFPVPLLCTATADTTVGSTCSLSTTFDAGVPMVKEGRRTIWGLDQIQLFDGGADGDGSTEDNTLFAVQGVFVP